MSEEKQPQIAIDPKIHSELKEFCKNMGWLIGATTDKILKKWLKEAKEKEIKSFF